MSQPFTIQSLIDDYTKGGKYGTLKLVFKAGNLVFVEHNETLLPFTQEKNSDVSHRRSDGPYDRVTKTNY